MTISDAVNGTGKVGEAPRRRVEAAIRETGYVPNAAARRLASPGSSRLSASYTRPSSTFLSAALVGAVIGASRVGVQLIAHDCGDADEKAIAAVMRARVADGAAALLLPPFAEMASGQPVITELSIPIGTISTISTGMTLPNMLTVRVDEQLAPVRLCFPFGIELWLHRVHRSLPRWRAGHLGLSAVLVGLFAAPTLPTGGGSAGTAYTKRPASRRRFR